MQRHLQAKLKWTICHCSVNLFSFKNMFFCLSQEKPMVGFLIGFHYVFSSQTKPLFSLQFCRVRCIYKIFKTLKGKLRVRPLRNTFSDPFDFIFIQAYCKLEIVRTGAFVTSLQPLIIFRSTLTNSTVCPLAGFVE